MAIYNVYNSTIREATYVVMMKLLDVSLSSYEN